jgi:hypothetical protein
MSHNLEDIYNLLLVLNITVGLLAVVGLVQMVKALASHPKE